MNAELKQSCNLEFHAWKTSQNKNTEEKSLLLHECVAALTLDQSIYCTDTLLTTYGRIHVFFPTHWTSWREKRHYWNMQMNTYKCTLNAAEFTSVLAGGIVGNVGNCKPMWKQTEEFKLKKKKKRTQFSISVNEARASLCAPGVCWGKWARGWEKSKTEGNAIRKAMCTCEHV